MRFALQVRIIVPEDVHTDIDSSHFTLSNVWDLSPKVIVRPAEAGYGNFDQNIGPFLAHSQLQPTPSVRVPCSPW